MAHRTGVIKEKYRKVMQKSAVPRRGDEMSQVFWEKDLRGQGAAEKYPSVRRGWPWGS